MKKSAGKMTTSSLARKVGRAGGRGKGERLEANQSPGFFRSSAASRAGPQDGVERHPLGLGDRATTTPRSLGGMLEPRAERVSVVWRGCIHRKGLSL